MLVREVGSMIWCGEMGLGGMKRRGGEILVSLFRVCAVVLVACGRGTLFFFFFHKRSGLWLSAGGAGLT